MKTDKIDMFKTQGITIYKSPDAFLSLGDPNQKHGIRGCGKSSKNLRTAKAKYQGPASKKPRGVGE